MRAKKIAWVVAALIGLGGVARAQSPGQQALMPVSIAASQLAARAASLERAGDLPLQVVQAQVGELGPYIDQLADLAAPLSVLAARIPDMRVTHAAMQQAAQFGAITDVADGATSLRQQVADLLVVVRNLQAGPFVAD